MGQDAVSVSVKFIPRTSRFAAAIRVDGQVGWPRFLDHVPKDLAEVYAMRIRNMRLILEANERRKRRGEPVLARSIWGLGNRIFLLRRDVELRFWMEIEDLYGHLERDLGLSRQTLSRIVTLRRYVPQMKMIPPGLTWSAISSSPKRFGEGLEPPQRRRKKRVDGKSDLPALFPEP